LLFHASVRSVGLAGISGWRQERERGRERERERERERKREEKLMDGVVRGREGDASSSTTLEEEIQCP
jgi:hypothetical protein